MESKKRFIFAIAAASLVYLGGTAFAFREWGSVLADTLLCVGLAGAFLFRRVRKGELQRFEGFSASMPKSWPALATSPGPGEKIASGVQENSVMVVDDDPECIARITAVLNRHHISCTAVKSGEPVLTIVEEGPLPGVLLLGMTERSGLEICRRLRKRYPASELPILILAKRQGKDPLSGAYEAGASDYIPRSFTAPELLARVRCHLDLRHAYETMKENLRLETQVRLQKEKNRTASRAAQREGLEKLRYQLRPHFLFNALATIRGAIFSDRQAAHDMVSHLAEFCRLTLVKGEDEVLTIEREMAIVSHYLAMEEMRYGAYMSVSIQIQPGAESLMIPAFIIQPLVENAIKYGARTSPDFLDITILAACREEGGVRIEISNTGEWVAPESGCLENSTGTGIKNVRARLVCFYGEDFLWEQRSGDGCVTISLSLPDIALPHTDLSDRALSERPLPDPVLPDPGGGDRAGQNRIRHLRVPSDPSPQDKVPEDRVLSE